MLKDALPDKGNAFGTPEHGLVVAIGTSYFSSDDFGVTNVLYALSNGCSIARAASSSGSPGDLAGTSMLATGQWAHQYVSGVLIVNNLHHCAVTQQTPTDWANPRASREVAALEAWDVVALHDSHVERTLAAVRHHELFQLPEPWPRVRRSRGRS